MPIKINPDNIYMFKITNRNTKKRCEIYSKLTVKIPEQRRGIGFDFYCFSRSELSLAMVILFFSFSEGLSKIKRPLFKIDRLYYKNFITFAQFVLYTIRTFTVFFLSQVFSHIFLTTVKTILG